MGIVLHEDVDYISKESTGEIVCVDCFGESEPEDSDTIVSTDVAESAEEYVSCDRCLKRIY